MLAHNAVIEPLSAEEVERIYWELHTRLGGSSRDDLTKLYITIRELRSDRDKANAGR